MDNSDTESHAARLSLFLRGRRRGFLTLEEVEEALPTGTLSYAERWLLLYSLRAVGIEIRGLSKLYFSGLLGLTG